VSDYQVRVQNVSHIKLEGRGDTRLPPWVPRPSVMGHHAQICLVLVLVTIMSAAATENGVWVAVDNRLDSFSVSGNHSEVVAGTKHIIGLSSPVFENNQFSSIFATELGSRGPSVYQITQSDQVLLAGPSDDDKMMPSYFEDITFEKTTNQLFLTSSNTKSIYSMSVKEGEGAVPRIFISTGNKKPSGITTDSCSGKIFWTNSDRKSPSIEVFHPATGNSWTLLSTNLTRPRGITVDSQERKLYWTDIKKGQFFISRSNLDGTDREVVCSGKDHDAFAMAVSKEFIYWSDWTRHSLWRTRKIGECRFELIQNFETSKPHGVAYIADTTHNCDEYNDITERPAVKHISTTEPTKEEIDEKAYDDANDTNENEAYCTNYCLHGDCQIVSGKPVCECRERFTGLRCETDKCFNFCLENGKCVIIEDEPECLCEEGFDGDRCEIRILLPLNQSNQMIGNTNTTVSTSPAMSSNINLLLYILGGTTVSLAIVVIALSVLVNKLRLRPRVVRKRFISLAGANKAEGKDTKQPINCGLPVEDGIQLDIENCCNMTLCDTPCFEPPTRGPQKGKGKKSCKGAADKKLLLDDEDEE